MERKVPPVFVFLITASLMVAVRYAVPSWAFTAAYGRPVAALLLAFGAGVGIAGVLAFGRVGTSFSPTEPERASTLVRDGIYRYTRNPMYVGLLFALLAWALWLGHPLSLVLVPVYVLYMNRFQISVEERVLADKFGGAYLQYKREVRRWL